jgi:hypothetical protein
MMRIDDLVIDNFFSARDRNFKDEPRQAAADDYRNDVPLPSHHSDKCDRAHDYCKPVDVT